MTAKLLRKGEVVRAVQLRGEQVRSDQLGVWLRDGVLRAAGRDGFGIDLFHPGVVEIVIALLHEQRKAAKL